MWAYGRCSQEIIERDFKRITGKSIWGVSGRGFWGITSSDDYWRIIRKGLWWINGSGFWGIDNRSRCRANWWDFW